MPRTATTADVFNTVGEPRRRAIIDCLDGNERGVCEMADLLDIDQPAVSKHLRTLREVGLVRVRRQGRHRLYTLNGHRLKAVHDWIQQFEHYWDNQLERIKEHAEQRPPGYAEDPPPPHEE